MDPTSGSGQGLVQPLISESITWYMTPWRQVWLQLYSPAYLFRQVLWSRYCQRLKYITWQRSGGAAPTDIQYSPALNMQGQNTGATPLSQLFIDTDNFLQFWFGLWIQQQVLCTPGQSLLHEAQIRLCAVCTSEQSLFYDVLVLCPCYQCQFSPLQCTANACRALHARHACTIQAHAILSWVKVGFVELCVWALDNTCGDSGLSTVLSSIQSNGLSVTLTLLQ